MKNLLFLILFLPFTQALLSQNINELEFPKTIKPEISESIQKYLFSNNVENLTKLDSLKTIERLALKENIIGNWEYIGNICSDCIKSDNYERVKKFIKITDKKIIFYNEKIAKKNITATESLEFTNQLDFFSDLTNVVYNDKSIWDLKVDKTKNFLKIHLSGKETENNRNRIVSGISTDYYKRIK